jgi:hypothetical protein
MGKYVKVYRSIIDPKDVADIFGRRIAKRFLVVQVTVTNRNKDYQFLIHDLSLDLSKISGLGLGDGHYELSSDDLSLLRGVAEKGQSDDRRNFVLRTLRGAGTVAAGLIGVTHFGKSYAPAVAVWNGPVVAAFTDVFPDYTINQMNRLNDSAYSANSIVAKQQSKVVAIFVPQAIFLSRAQQKKFWSEPTSLWSEVDLRKIKIYVDGNFITNVEDIPPSLNAAVVAPNEMKAFQNAHPEVKGSISGNYLSGTDLKLLNTDLNGVSIRLDGTPSDNRVDFVVSSELPLPPGKVLKIGVTKKGQETPREIDLAVQYSAAPPALTTVEPDTITQGDADKVLTLTGSNFLPGATQVVIVPSDGITVGAVEVSDSKTLTVKVTATDSAATTDRHINVMTAGGTGPGLTLKINKK